MAQQYIVGFTSQAEGLWVPSGRSKPQNTSLGLQNWLSGFRDFLQEKMHCAPSIAPSIYLFLICVGFIQSKQTWTKLDGLKKHSKNSKSQGFLYKSSFHSNLFGEVLDKCLPGPLADADACRRTGRGRRKIAKGSVRSGYKHGEYQNTQVMAIFVGKR